MKHKHADLIHAWADGAEIQIFTLSWEDISSPSWDTDLRYRIKPEPRVIHVHKRDDGEIRVDVGDITDIGSKPIEFVEKL